MITSLRRRGLGTRACPATPIGATNKIKIESADLLRIDLMSALAGLRYRMFCCVSLAGAGRIKGLAPAFRSAPHSYWFVATAKYSASLLLVDVKRSVNVSLSPPIIHTSVVYSIGFNFAGKKLDDGVAQKPPSRWRLTA
jgi:hypothetical protein